MTQLILLKALSEIHRLRVVSALLIHAELCACQLVELLELKGATVSRHLALMVSAGLLKSRKEGRWIYFSLNKKALAPALFRWLQKDFNQEKLFVEDKNKLAQILLCEPETLCRKQRGEKCCPC